jgi:hypothetical protein
LIWWEIFQSSLLFLWLTNKKTAYSCLYVIAVNTKYDINLYREKKWNLTYSLKCLLWHPQHRYTQERKEGSFKKPSRKRLEQFLK